MPHRPFSEFGKPPNIAKPMQVRRIGSTRATRGQQARIGLKIAVHTRCLSNLVRAEVMCVYIKQTMIECQFILQYYWYYELEQSY